MLEKLGTKNLAVCKNEGTQHKLRVMKEKSKEGMMQKRQKID